MRKTLLLSLFAIMAMGVYAQTDNSVTAGVAPQQTVKYGYISYDKALKLMPEYALAVKDEADLRAKYDAEAQRVENEFNVKYENFLEGQRDFPETILQKRQTELQEMFEKNVKFKEESQRLLEAAKVSMYAPAHNRLTSILFQIGQECGYAFILNTDNNACPFLNPQMGEDVMDKVKASLQ